MQFWTPPKADKVNFISSLIFMRLEYTVLIKKYLITLYIYFDFYIIYIALFFIYCIKYKNQSPYLGQPKDIYSSSLVLLYLGLISPNFRLFCLINSFTLDMTLLLNIKSILLFKQSSFFQA